MVAYTDFPRRPTDAPLTELERRGLAVWRGNNCQACHQIYGFGGFLGPDLTNRVTDATPDAEFRAILEEGARSMPAFQMPPADQEAVLSFLRAVNRTGQSQPTPLATIEGVSPIIHFERIAEEWVQEGGVEMADEGLGHGGQHARVGVRRSRAEQQPGRRVDGHGGRA